MAAEEWTVLSFLILQDKIPGFIFRICQIQIVDGSLCFSVCLHTGGRTVLTTITFVVFDDDAFHIPHPFLYLKSLTLFQNDLF